MNRYHVYLVGDASDPIQINADRVMESPQGIKFVKGEKGMEVAWFERPHFAGYHLVSIHPKGLEPSYP